MKKKVKKIPKFKDGGLTWKDMSNNQRWNAGIEAVGAIGNTISTAMSGQDVTLGGALSSAGSLAATGFKIGGPIGAGVGAAAGLIAGTAGRKNSVNENSTSTSVADIAEEGSGWMKWFGMSEEEMMAKANRIANANISEHMTEQIRSKYAMNPNNPNGGTILAAEGGIIPNTLWYEDDGEYGRTPYGEIYKEPEQGKPKDSNLVQGPAGTQILSDKLKYPGTKDTFAKHYEKSIAKVKNYGNDKYAKNSQLLNDKYAQKQFDEHLAVLEEMKNKKIKKVKNGIPAHEDGKNGKEELAAEIAARKKSSATGFIYKRPDGVFVMQDHYGNQEEIPEHMLWGIKQADNGGYYFDFTQTGVTPSAGKWNGSMNFAKQMLNSKNIAKLKNSATRVFGRNVKPANVNGPVKPVTGTSPEVLGKPKTVQEAALMARNERTANMWQQLTSKGSVPQKTLEGPQTWATARGSSNLWENPMALQSGDDIASAINTAYYLNKGLPTALGVSAILGGGGTFLLHEATKDKQPTTVNTDKPAVVTALEKPVEPVVTSTEVPTENEKKEVVVPKKNSINKPSSSKKTTASRVTTSTAPSPEDTVVRRPIYEEPIKTVTVPTDDTKVYGRDGRVAYDYTAPETKVTPQDLGRTVDDNNNYTGSNWKDNLYRMAVLSQPLWDRAKAEPVNYESPVYKYMPTQIDVSSQLRDTDQSYTLSRYNFANLYPNTGAGMAAGLQAASNRAKQYADIRQWQTNAQNELIGKNVGIYNNWANEHARILNDVYNKSAQNRATARNINRQNRAAALSNFGTMLSDDKKMAMERMKFNILKPAIRSTYEDATANDLMNMYNSLFG